jgi:phosphoribosylformylglycinamidine synthase
LSSTANQKTQQRWLAEVFVSLKPAVNDPQGLAIKDGLHMLGYREVEDVRAGKYMQLHLTASSQGDAEARLTDEQIRDLETLERGEAKVAVNVWDDENEKPLECVIVWAWRTRSA